MDSSSAGGEDGLTPVPPILEILLILLLRKEADYLSVVLPILPVLL